MKKGRHYTEEEIKVIAQSAIGKTFKDIIDSEIITVEKDKIQKGSFGNIIEEALFGIEKNSESEPDFIDAGIELKVTPYRKNRDNSLSAKERLVLNQIDYDTEFANEFKFSHFWFKNSKLEILWYLYDDDKERLDYIITHEILLNLELSEDLKQIEKDYYYIISKIKQGKAHELSEADTMYLGACTKGSDSNDLRKQPFSNIPAMRRAFCFKNSYMTQLVRKYIGNYYDVEKLLNNTELSFDDFIANVINKYIGKSQKELMKEFNIDSSAKNLNSIIINRMFGVKGSLNETEEFLKAQIVPRTIRIEENGKIKESMPFPAFNYCELAKENWENSSFRNILEETKYLFFVFKKKKDNYYFKGIKLWNMPEIILDSEVKKMWNKTVKTIQSGNIVKEINSRGIRTTNFPGMADNKYCHVRPHAKDANDTLPLPIRDKLTGLDKYTKHCFWINNKYLEEILKDYI